MRQGMCPQDASGFHLADRHMYIDDVRPATVDVLSEVSPKALIVMAIQCTLLRPSKEY